MRYRRNSDEGLRRLERAVSAGDVEAAVAYLFKVAQTGTWFKPRDWKAEGEFPYAHMVNANAAYYVRLLAYLRWSGARDLQAAVATQVPPREERTYSYSLGSEATTYTALDRPEPMHALAHAKPFAKIGDKTAEGIGPRVMEALAGAAAEHVFPLTKEAPALWTDAAEAVHGVKRAEAEWRRRRDLIGFNDESFQQFKDEQDPHNRTLWKLVSGMRPPLNAPFGSAAGQAGAEAREAYVGFFGAFGYNRHDTPRHWAGAYHHAERAAAWACEAARGGEGVSTVEQGGWYQRVYVNPRRGCVIQGNREIRQAVTPAVLLAIATQIMRYR
jgi:hypothetical protein